VELEFSEVENLSVNFFSVAHPDNQNRFGSFIRFINDSIIAVSERITTFFLTFQGFAGVGICVEGTYAF